MGFALKVAICSVRTILRPLRSDSRNESSKLLASGRTKNCHRIATRIRGRPIRFVVRGNDQTL